MEQAILALCDVEEEYAQLMTEFLQKHRDLPWEIHTYTKVDELLRQERKTDIALLVIAESAFCEEVCGISSKRLVVLNESGVLRWDNVKNINKYQEADQVLRELLEIYAEIAGRQLPRMKSGSGTKLIGIYSPVRRCLQTGFALSMSQILAQQQRTLYLNFEHYAGITELLPDMQTRDLADLLYFLTSEKDKFRLRMQTIVQQRGELDYVPPMKAGQNLLQVPAQEWMSLLQKLEDMEEYTYIVLDLSESIQGLFDILRQCCKVYTLVKEDRIAQSKLMQYEQMLTLADGEDILRKTCKCSIPSIHRLPEELEQYTRGALAEYVRDQMKDLLV